MFLYKYILEIKNRAILIIVCWVISFAVCYFYKEALIFMLVKLSVQKKKLSLFYFISTDLTDVLSAYIELSYFISIQITVLIICYHILMFFSPGLFVYEYKRLKNMLLVSLSFVVISIFVFNVYVLPYVWSFFLSFSYKSFFSISVFFESKVTEFVYLYKNFNYITILLGQFFSLFYFSSQYIENKRNFILQTRKTFYFIFLILATTITPPDIVSQLFLISVFVIIFEFLSLIIVLKTFNKLIK